MSERGALRTFRIGLAEWEAAKSVADARGESLSAVIRDALKRYVTRHAPKP